MSETIVERQPHCNSNPSLVTEPQMKREVFPPDRQPSTRWLRELRRKKAIPYIKLAGMVFYDVAQVRAAIAKKFTVRSRHDA